MNRTHVRIDLHRHGVEDPDPWASVAGCRTRAHADAIINDLPLTAPGLVPWRKPSEVTLHEMLVHMIVETGRHLGQADILRESIDGSVGYYPAQDNLPAMNQDWWTAYRDRLERVARQVGR